MGLHSKSSSIVALLAVYIAAAVIADRPLTDLYMARDAGGGTQYAPVSFWGPTIITTNNNVTLAWAQADQSPVGHDSFNQLRRSHDGGRTWEPPLTLKTGNPAALYSKTTGTLFMFPGIDLKPYTVSAMPCELHMAWIFNETSGELSQNTTSSWGPFGLSSCAKSAVGHPGAVLGIVGID